MKQSDIDAYNKAFDRQAELQKQVDICRMLSGNDLYNVQRMMGGDPVPKLAEVNNIINEWMVSTENELRSMQDGFANNRTILSEKAESIKAFAVQNTNYKNDLKGLQSEQQSLQAQINEENQLYQLKQQEYTSIVQSKLDLITSMNPKQQSFVLQKALDSQNDDIISLLLSVDLDPNFQNADGVSLMQTAQDAHNQQVIEMLGNLMHDVDD